MLSSQEFAEIKKILEEHEARISKLEKYFKTKPETVQKKVSIKEFLLSNNLKDDVQKTLAIGYYLESYEDFSCFNIRDLEDSFKKSREPVPKNLNDKVNKNIKKGHMMEAKEKKDNRKAWVLTNSGETFVDNNFK